MSHKLLNSSEDATFQRVWKVAEKNWAHVWPLVRLKDAIPVKRGGDSYAEYKRGAVSEADFTFALMAHLDFLVLDAEYHPLFAVEFDGPVHETDPQQQRRDRQKDALMERFELPLLRINAKYLNRKFRGFDLLSYFIELWFWHQQRPKKEQETTRLVGPFDDPDEVFDDPDEIPFDETLVPDVALTDACEDPSWPYDLSEEIDAKIHDLFKTGQVASSSPHYWIGQDENAALYRCIMWILLPRGRCCFVETAMRHKQFPVGLCFILEQITVFNLFEQIQSVLGGERAARTSVKLKERLDYYASHFAFRLSCAANQWLA